MEDLQKYFVPYDMALRMKGIEFDKPCTAVYFGNGENELFTYSLTISKEMTKKMVESGHIPCPTIQQAFEWFREKHELYGHVRESYGFDNSLEFISQINGTFVNNDKSDVTTTRFQSWNNAELACLDTLIKIVEEKKD